MLMFIDINSSFIKTLLLIGYFLLGFYAFRKGKEIRIKRKEKALFKKLYSILETENLPLYKGGSTVNWSKVYTMLKNITPSPERDEIMEFVKAKKSARKR